MRNRSSYTFPFAKYPAIRIAILLIAGILTGYYSAVDSLWWFVALFILMTVFAIAEYRYARSYKMGFFHISVGSFLCIVIVTGALWQTVFDRQEQPPSARLLDAYVWENATFMGTLTNIRETSSGKYQLDVTVDTTVLEDSLYWLEAYLLRAVFDAEQQPLPDGVQIGNRLYFDAVIYPLQDKSNPHEFDYKQYLASQKIYTQVGIDSIIATQSAAQWFSWYRFRGKALSLIDQNFNKETIPLAKALLLGYKNELAREEKIAFSRVGLSHIMAVSGLHVGFILAPFWLIIPFFWTLRRGRELGLVLLLILLLGYAGLTGFSASVMRASITGGLITYGRLFHKARDSINLTAVAAIIILLLNPNELFEIGFQLSFAAVYIILLTIPVLQQVIPSSIRYRWYGIPVMVVLVSIVVQLGLYPLLSYYFGEFSLAGPVANALIVPGLTFIVPFALFLLPVSALFPQAGLLLNAPCRWFLDFIQWFVANASTWNWSWIQTSSDSFLLFFVWAASILLIASLPIPKLRWKIGVLLLGILCFQQSIKLYQKFQPPLLEVTMLDVGQGDATYIKTPLGKHILIDAGRWTPGYNSARYVIIPHLKALGVQKLDAVFLSHPHADHIGGIVELINEMPIDTIYNSGFIYESELYKSYLVEASENKIPVKSLQAGTIIPIDPTMRIFVYGPGPENHHTDPNERSLILELIYGETEFLFMGDGGAAQETYLLKNYGSLIDTDFLKVGHHGSRTASSPAFLKMATPDLSAVSLAKNNRFSHPHPEAITNLKQSGTALHYTSLDGALQFSSDGHTIQKIKWR